MSQQTLSHFDQAVEAFQACIEFVQVELTRQGYVLPQRLCALAFLSKDDPVAHGIISELNFLWLANERDAPVSEVATQVAAQITGRWLPPAMNVSTQSRTTHLLPPVPEKPDQGDDIMEQKVGPADVQADQTDSKKGNAPLSPPTDQTPGQDDDVSNTKKRMDAFMEPEGMAGLNPMPQLPPANSSAGESEDSNNGATKDGNVQVVVSGDIPGVFCSLKDLSVKIFLVGDDPDMFVKPTRVRDGGFATTNPRRNRDDENPLQPTVGDTLKLQLTVGIAFDAKVLAEATVTINDDGLATVSMQSWTYESSAATEALAVRCESLEGELKKLRDDADKPAPDPKVLEDIQRRLRDAERSLDENHGVSDSTVDNLQNALQRANNEIETLRSSKLSRANLFAALNDVLSNLDEDTEQDFGEVLYNLVAPHIPSSQSGPSDAEGFWSRKLTAFELVLLIIILICIPVAAFLLFG